LKVGHKGIISSLSSITSSIASLGLSKTLTILVLQGNHHVMLTCSVEKQLNNSISWKILLKTLLLPTGVFVSAWQSCYASPKYFCYFNNDKNVSCMLYLVYVVNLF